MCVCHIIIASIDGKYEDSWALNQGLNKTAGWASIAFIWLFAVNFAYSWGRKYIEIFLQRGLPATTFANTP